MGLYKRDDRETDRRTDKMDDRPKMSQATCKEENAPAVRTLVRYRLAASAFYFIQGFVVTCWVSRLPDIKERLSLSDGVLGLVLLAPPAGQLAAMALSGWLVRRFGSFRILCIAGLLLPCWLPVLGLVSARAGLIAALVFFGMATNLSNISVNTQCVGIEHLYGKSIMATFHGIWSLGGIGAILLSSFCAVRGISPAVNFLFCSALMILLYLANFRRLLPQDRRTAGDGANKVRLASLLTDSRLWILGIISLGCLGCEGVMNNWIAIFFQKFVTAKAEFIRLGLFTYMLSITCCRFTADRFVRKWGGRTVIQIAGCLILAGISLIVLIPSLFTAAAGCILTGMGTSVIVPVCYGIAGKYESVPVAVSITMVATVGFLGFLFMPAAVGVLSELAGLKTALFLTGLVSCAAAQLIWKAGKA